MFLTGQKVVCINDTGLQALKDAGILIAIPQAGKVYVIRGITIGIKPITKQEELAVYLIGIHNPKSSVVPHPERGFDANRFRALDELTTDEILHYNIPKEDYAHT